MSSVPETSVEEAHPSRPISRRDFLHFGGGLLAGTVGSMVGKEVLGNLIENTALPEVRTKFADFTFAYERPDEPVNLEKYPQNANCVIAPLPPEFFELEPRHVVEALDHKATSSEEGYKSWTQASGRTLSSYLSYCGIDLAFYQQFQDEEAIREHQKSESLATAVASFALLFGTSGKLLERLSATVLLKKEAAQEPESDKPVKEALPTRRKFLQYVMAASAVIGSVGPIKALSHVLSTSEYHNLKKDTPLQRIAIKIEGFLSSTNPADHLVLFQDLMTAIRIDHFSRRKLRDLQERPKIVVKLGTEHALVETFLQLGREGCLALLSLYPDDLLDSFLSLTVSPEDMTEVLELWSERGEYDGNRLLDDDEARMLLKRKIGYQGKYPRKMRKITTKDRKVFPLKPRMKPTTDQSS